ncbi:HupE/UreJ family protein [uncultured Thiohalocapsa sp.]|uniref:HupE/UreJ family protein n=1 Tax=uncultured Thiohalocapsa sp. TaxID=768990 RepID=UPI0025F134BF|nr:HupE/UreJ family protein [uncultured Thiohalocapsa sp.]
MFLLPGAAQAHLVSSGLGPFYDGALHLLLSPLDLLALLAVVVLAGHSGRAPARWAVIALPIAWAVAWLGAMWIGAAAPEAAPALDALKIGLLTLAGVAVAAGLRAPALVVAAIAAAAGIVCGLGGGLVAADTGAGAVAFAGLWTAVLILGLLAAAVTVSLERPALRIALRVVGSWIAAVGVLAAGWVLQGFA